MNIPSFTLRPFLVVLALSLCAIRPTQAAPLAPALQGTYVLKSVTILIDGQNSGSKFTKFSVPIGPKGLKGSNNGTKLKNALMAVGAGSDFTLSITNATTTSLSCKVSGNFGHNGGVTNASGTGTATIGSAGLKVKFTINGTASGHPATLDVKILLKKA